MGGGRVAADTDTALLSSPVVAGMTVSLRRLLPGVLVLELALIALSAVVDSRPTDAAPELLAGAVVVAAVAAVSITRSARTDRLLSAAGLTLLVGGLVTLYGGFATLALVPHRVTLALVGDAALVAGFALFLYDRYGR